MVQGLRAAAAFPRGRTGWRFYADKLQKSLSGAPKVPLAIALGIVVVAIFVPFIAPHPYDAQNLQKPLLPPAWMTGGDRSYILGTDELGQDTLSRLLYGARISLIVATLAVAASGALGTLIGLVSGFWGGKVDMALMRLTDVAISIPALLIALLFAAILGAGLDKVLLIIAMTTWTGYARLVRAEVLGLRESDFVALAKVAGAGRGRLLLRHILPNVGNLLIVLATLAVGRVILFEAALSFLGVGVQPPTPSWGLMLSDGLRLFYLGWWFATFPGIAISLTVLSANLLGDWLRDALDPKQRQV